ncbi:MAG: APC family permease [Curtobacterium sp.]
MRDGGVVTAATDTTAVDKGLRTGTLGLFGSVVMGISSTAPAYSLAASLGLVVASGGALLAGVKAPAIMLLAFIPMWMIAVAYHELNKEDPDCGTTFTWATRAFGAVTGWLGGWGIIAADVIVMANLAQIAGSYGYTFVGVMTNDPAISALGSSTLWSTVAGVLWIAVMTVICYVGVEVSARLQYVLLGIEVLVLVMFAAVALVRVGTGHGVAGSIAPSLSWLWPSGMDFGSVIAPAMAGTPRCRSTRRRRTPRRRPVAQPSSAPCCCSSSTRSCPSPRSRSPGSARRASASARSRTPTTCSRRSARPSSGTPSSATPRWRCSRSRS